MTDAQEAFEDAISDGVLNTDENSPLFAHNWMWMGVQRLDSRTQQGRFDAFKNINSRRYIYGIRQV